MTQISFEQSVLVKLTDQGVRKFEQFFGKLSDGQQVRRNQFPALPHPDEEGWYALELWMLVSVFGGYSLRQPEDTAELFEGNVISV